MLKEQTPQALFAQKLAKAKVQIGKMVQDKTTVVGGGRTAKYTSLDTIYQTLTKVLAENNLVMTIENNIDRLAPIIGTVDNPELSFAQRGWYYVLDVTLIDTETGFLQTYIYKCLVDKPQADIIKSYGSMMTYLQRYACEMLFSLQSSAIDPDEYTAPVKSELIKQVTPTAIKYLAKNTYTGIYNTVKDTLKNNEQTAILNALGITSWTQIPVDKQNELVIALNESVRNKGEVKE